MSVKRRRPTSAHSKAVAPIGVEKAPTGISGLDELTSGGLPRGRPTLVCGGAGCGKTVLGLEFLVRGATLFGEPGAIFTFEETRRRSSRRTWHPSDSISPRSSPRRSWSIDHVQIERSEVEETGEYDLDGLFIRLAHAIDSIGAKRVLLDTIETLFTGLANKDILRSELRRLFRWLKDKGVTAVITGERGESSLTRNGLEEYVSDCVILLDLRVQDQISTRRLRVVKYRGARHGTDEYPFLIGENGISVLPVSSLRLVHEASDERMSSGNAELDAMLGGGYYRGSSILVSGPSGTGKTSVAACLAATCAARRAGALLLVRGVARSADPQHEVDWDRPGARRSRRGAFGSSPRGRPGSGWRRTSSRSTRPSRSSNRRSSSSIPSPISCRSGTTTRSAR